MEGQGGHIPRFGDWKTGQGDATPYTMYFDDARLRRSTGGATPPPKPRPATPSRGNSTPPTHRRAGATNEPKDRTTSRSRRQSSVGHGGSIPPWGQWNDGNAGGGGTQQYTIVFDEQMRDRRRSAPSTPHIEQLRPPTPPRKKSQSQHDHVPKIFTCFGLFGK